jgi:hypothetical protein
MSITAPDATGVLPINDANLGDLTPSLLPGGSSDLRIPAGAIRLSLGFLAEDGVAGAFSVNSDSSESGTISNGERITSKVPLEALTLLPSSTDIERGSNGGND